MAISMDAIKKLRAMTGAGLADVKKALTEAEGDMDKISFRTECGGISFCNAFRRTDRQSEGEDKPLS